MGEKAAAVYLDNRLNPQALPRAEHIYELINTQTFLNCSGEVIYDIFLAKFVGK
jgi:hypothetical protein